MFLWNAGIHPSRLCMCYNCGDHSMIVCHCENLKTVANRIFVLENISFRIPTSHPKVEIVLNFKYSGNKTAYNECFYVICITVKFVMEVTVVAYFVGCFEVELGIKAVVWYICASSLSL
jgi:hypothetical protein